MINSRPWTAVYPSGIPANIDPTVYPTILEYLKDTCEKYKKKPAFSFMGKEITYGELDKKSTDFGAYLQSRGLEPGDKVAIMLPNLLQYPIALFGILKAGLIVVNTNPLYTPREMEHQFSDSGAKAILILENFVSKLEQIIQKTSIKVVISTSIGGMLGTVKGSLVNFAIRNVKRMVPKHSMTNLVTFNEALKQGKKFDLNSDFENGPGDVIALQYTGGTTGVSKGAMLTNENLVANMMQIKTFITPYMGGDTSNQVILAPLPLYHIFAFTVNCLACMDLGALSVLVANPKDLKTVVKEFERYTITGMTGVNTLYNALLNFEPFQKTNWSELKFVAAGGTALQKSVAEAWKKMTDQDISEGYGMTEASPVVTSNPHGKTKIGSVGVPVPSTDVQIVDDSGKVLELGETGEIQVKGPQVMKGYYNKPEETAKTITADGWLNTGDIGFIDEEGYLKIVDRKKDMILVSGFNVYPNEIEDVVSLHPKVLEVAAVGMKSEKSGECVKVFVVKKDQSLNEGELIQHCRENLTGYKVPKMVEFREDLPKTNVGKILRRKLKE
ncbi:MAG: AMP-binding protein [Saprospiraceae bacterium]|nr:AMP-binding protein [Bacteroidia bacterium]NNE14163.1 AMP-binding protein [Saprospiraceae bacterium]NNL93522.1 AMP-binding protein [Saprospiraceae bacterium]